MNHFSEWGIALYTDQPGDPYFCATGKLFFDMHEYFDAPEREMYKVSRTELEEYIRTEQELNFRRIDEEDCEWINLIKFLSSSKQEKFWLCAWW